MFNFQSEMVIIHQVGVEWRWQTFLIFMFIYFFHIFFKGNSRIDTTTFFFIVNTYNCSHNSELAMGILNLKQYEPSSLNLYLKVIVQIYLLPLLLHCSQSLTKKITQTCVHTFWLYSAVGSYFFNTPFQHCMYSVY